MADQFDIVDIVYDTVEPVGAGFTLYKDCSGDGETKNHITIRMLALSETDVVNKGAVNINVFVKKQTNGMLFPAVNERGHTGYKVCTSED